MLKATTARRYNGRSMATVLLIDEHRPRPDGRG
jgi:hypothetical protein